jgi:hypothetical protein
MKREIKIRTYSEKLGKYIGEWGVFHNPIDESFQSGPPSGIQGEIYHEQFTGLLDSKGVEIYEGDVIKSINIDEYCDSRTVTEKIEVVEGLNKYIETLSWIPKHGEVIGTIHDAEYKELAK